MAQPKFLFRWSVVCRRKIFNCSQKYFPEYSSVRFPKRSADRTVSKKL